MVCRTDKRGLFQLSSDGFVLCSNYSMVRERLRDSCRHGSGFYACNYTVEGNALAQRLGAIMNMLYDMQNEVHHYGEDTQTRVQELHSMVLAVIDWCDEVAQVFGVQPPFLSTGMQMNIPILAPLG